MDGLFSLFSQKRISSLSNPNGDSWFLIFHHNAKYGDLFKNEKEVLFYKGKNKFSLLSRINDKFKINDDYFEFMIYYPDYDDYVQFTQPANPIYSEFPINSVDILHGSENTNNGLLIVSITFSELFYYMFYTVKY